ncbi:MAG TPA: CoxE, partial [Baekduia sp.]|nr:CoxE [Baekduia sp.]
MPPLPHRNARRAGVHGSAQLERPGMAGRLLEFGEELRGEGVAIGTSELLDAFAALQHVPWTEQVDFREALAATLAKSQDDRRVFELVFDRFFFRAAELAAIEEGVREEGGISPDDAGAMDMEELRRQVAAAVRDGNQALMRDLARLAIAAFGRQGEGSGVIGVDVQRIRRSLNLRAEPQPELPPDDPRFEGLPRDEIRRFEAMLRQELERGQIERTEQLSPARALNEL